MIKHAFQNEYVPNGAPNIFEGEIDFKIISKSLANFKIKVTFLAVTVLWQKPFKYAGRHCGWDPCTYSNGLPFW